MDTTNVTNMDYMISGCEKLQILNINGMNTNNVVSMKAMFSRLPLMTSLDISSFNLLNVTNMDNMFDGSSALVSVKMMSDIYSLVSVVDMFNGISTSGEFKYNINYNYARIIAVLPKSWNAIEA
jgi:surface protein